MAERRALIEGITSPAPAVDPETERAFVFGTKKVKEAETSETLSTPTTQAAGAAQARVPLSTRMRADFSTALKRASLERQLAGIEPNTLTDILEQAVEPWLRSNGYLK
jgi:hypothetical protein